MPYDLFEHRHRFASWAAARAAQRAFASVDILRAALEETDLADFLRQPASVRTDTATFERHHRRWCSTILGVLEENGVPGATYGRAAKLVAVYLKSMVVLGPASGSPLSAVIHPPIDSLLLENLAASGLAPSYAPRWRRLRWTRLDEPAYYELIAELKTVLRDGEPFWKLEEYWTVSRNSPLKG